MAGARRLAAHLLDPREASLIPSREPVADADRGPRRRAAVGTVFATSSPLYRPEEATRLIKAMMGMTDRASFFNPENLQRLMGARL